MKRKFIVLFFGLICLASLSYFIFFSNSFLLWLFEDKIWVHRVNSIEKLNEVQTKFNGVELDIVFLDSLNEFDINHPPEPSIQLFLDNYLSSVNKNSSLHFWLDFKNLEIENQKNALNKLNSICDSLSLNRIQIIVESGNVALLTEFSKAGYEISYYLHWPGLYSLDKNQFQNQLTQIKSNLESLNYQGYLSSDYRDYYILKENFPKHKILLWLEHPFGKENKFKDRIQLYKLLLDNQVKILLMKYKSNIKER